MPFRIPKLPNAGPLKNAPLLMNELYSDTVSFLILASLGFPDVSLSEPGALAPQEKPVVMIPESTGDLDNLERASDAINKAIEQSARIVYNVPGEGPAVFQYMAEYYSAAGAEAEMLSGRPIVVLSSPFKNQFNLFAETVENRSLSSIILSDAGTLVTAQDAADSQAYEFAHRTTYLIELAASLGYVPVTNPYLGEQVVFVISGIAQSFKANLLLEMLELPEIAKYIVNE